MSVIPFLSGGAYVLDRLLVVVPAGADFNLFTALGSPTIPNMRMYALIDQGVVLTASTTALWGFDTGLGWVGTPDLVIENRNTISGMGGAGGVPSLYAQAGLNEWFGGGGGGGAGAAVGVGAAGRMGDCATGFPGMNGTATLGGAGGAARDNVACASVGYTLNSADGQVGGVAMRVTIPTTLYNDSGVIGGGGGGGGGGGFDDFLSPDAKAGGTGGDLGQVGVAGGLAGIPSPLSPSGAGGLNGAGIAVVGGTQAELLTIIGVGGTPPQLLGGITEAP